MPIDPESYGRQLAEVWNDTVRIRDLAAAAAGAVVFGLVFYLLAAHFLPRLGWGNPEQQKGYALLFGILGCLASGVLAALLFPPKRNLSPGTRTSFRESLTHLGLDPDQERAAIRESDPENRQELRELGILRELDPWN